MDVTDKIELGFKCNFVCRSCGGSDVGIDFYEGYDAAPGYLIIRCNECQNEIDVDVDD